MYKYSNSVKKQKNENIVFLEKEFSHEVDRMFYTKVNSMIMAFIYNIFIYIYIHIEIFARQVLALIVPAKKCCSSCFSLFFCQLLILLSNLTK